MNGWQLLFWFLRAWFVGRAKLAAENWAFRQQLATYKYQKKRPRVRVLDRVFWVWMSRLWSDWRSTLVIVQPATVVGWHRQGFRLYWRWKSRGGKPGRPRIERQVQVLIRRMSRENPLWGVPRIQSELRLLGHDLAESTVALYIDRRRKPQSPTWKAFLANHLPDLAAVDFFVVPTATFRLLYCFVVLRLERRHVVHFNVTANPSALWTAQQVVEAFPFDTAPRFLQRDRDGTYGEEFQRRTKNLGVEEVVSAPRSPWQNPYAERLIGSIRRELLHHVIVLHETHLKRLLSEFFVYYHESRTHLSLDRNAPMPRDVEFPERGKVVALSLVGGLHHRYTRRAA